jgi:predicted kinase
MEPPGLIVVTGQPAAGKSTLARRLAKALGSPLLAKDHFKERLFASQGSGDRAWSRHLSDLAWEQLFGEAARLLAAGGTVVAEGNFRPGEHEAPLQGLAHAAGARLVQVHCSTPAAIRLARIANRARRGTRHRGHLDAELLAEAGGSGPGGDGLLSLDAPVVIHDGAAPAAARWPATLAEVLRVLAGS